MMVLSLDARVPETDRSRARPESARERVARRTSLEPRAGFALARARRRGRASRARARGRERRAPRDETRGRHRLSNRCARARACVPRRRWTAPADALPERRRASNDPRRPRRDRPESRARPCAGRDRASALDGVRGARGGPGGGEAEVRGAERPGKERKPPRTARSSGADAPRARRSLAEAIGGRIEIRRESGRRGAGVYSWRIEKSNRRFLSHRRTRGCFCIGCGEMDCQSGREGKASRGEKATTRRRRALNAMAPALGKRPRLCGGGTSGKTCVHGMSWEGYNCRECPGKGICEHGRRRSRCKECGGSRICEHGRERNFCKECGGSSICEHGRVRTQCKECGGSSICKHGRRRSSCKECGGSSICEHGRVRTQCKECGGSSICEHGRVRSQCKECGGSQICKHGRRRTQCKECGGGSICEHGRQRSSCKECGGGSICEHGRVRSTCKECGGAAICEHGRER